MCFDIKPKTIIKIHSLLYNYVDTKSEKDLLTIHIKFEIQYQLPLLFVCFSLFITEEDR